MAFYTSRVDQAGNEIERRQSARSLNAASLSSGTTRTSLSSTNSRRLDKYKYVNTAAFIQKAGEFSDLSDASSLTSDGSDGRSIESLGNRGDDNAQDETRSDIVPPLDLRSEDNFPTRGDYTFSFRSGGEGPEIEVDPKNAFETWLSAKKKTISDEAARKKREMEEKKRMEEERKRLAEEKYQKWLERKAQQQIKVKMQLQRRASPPMEVIEQQAQKKAVKPEMDDEEAQRKLEEWERKKREENEKRKWQKKLEEERRAKEEEERKRLAAEAWDKWNLDVKKKPKPVPLNRGIFTLRGTISDHWVNPNEWKTD